MRLQDLQDYLCNSISVEELQKRISTELSTYKNELKKKGGTVNIRIDGDEFAINITKQHYDTMQRDFLNDKCDKYFLSYLSDVLLLSEYTEFEDDDLLDKFESLTEI